MSITKTSGFLFWATFFGLMLIDLGIMFSVFSSAQILGLLVYLNTKSMAMGFMTAGSLLISGITGQRALRRTLVGFFFKETVVAPKTSQEFNKDL